MDRGLLAIFAALMVPWSLLVYRSWFVCDDAYISFRYARNWAAGDGVRYNLGDGLPVEGYSEFLWVAVGAAVTVVGLDQVQILTAFSAGFGALLLFLTLRAARQLGLGEPATALAGLMLVGVPTFTVWSTGGMGTMLHALLVFAVFDLLALRADRNANYALAAFLGLGLALVRVEGLAWVLVVVFAAGLYRVLEKRPVLGPLSAVLGVTALGFAAFEAWRWGYYDAPIANTYYAKVKFGPEALVRGGRYVGAFFLTYLTPMLAGFGFAIGVTTARRNQILALGIPAGATLGYGLLVGGDFMAHFRLMLPGLPFLGLLAAMGLQTLLEQETTPRGRLRMATIGCLVAVVGIAPAFDLHVLPNEIRARHEGPRLDDPDQEEQGVTSEQQFWLKMKNRGTGFARRGRILAEQLPSGASIVLSAVGGIGYHTDLHVYDRNGLIERRAKRGEKSDGRLPGHDQTAPLSDYLQYKPDVLYFRIFSEGPLCRQTEGVIKSHVLDGYAPELRRIEMGDQTRWLFLVRPKETGVDAMVAFEEACQTATREFKRNTK